MAWLDLQTHAVHAFVIYRDGETVILWSPGGETQVTAAEFGERVAYDPAAYVPQIAERFEELGISGDHLARFQNLDPGAELTPAAEARRAALAAYAEGNGGQITTHQASRPRLWSTALSIAARVYERSPFGPGAT